MWWSWLVLDENAKEDILTQDKKALRRHKTMNYSIALLLFVNSISDWKLKSLVMYHSEIPSFFSETMWLKVQKKLFYVEDKQENMGHEANFEWVDKWIVWLRQNTMILLSLENLSTLFINI